VESIHVIGHSLGAHISGFTGKYFTTLTGKKLGRITGLDPAGPCFAQLGPNFKLKATDAQFVDVIHTNGGVAGLKEPVGKLEALETPEHASCLCEPLSIVLYY
jgi:hypothetical protein